MRISLLVFAALAAVVNCEFEVKDLPQQMQERLEKYIEIKRKWAEMWSSMSKEMRAHYEEVLVDRLDKVPKIHLIRIHEIVERMPAEYQHQLLVYMKQKFPAESGGVEVKKFESELDEIDAIMSRLPKAVRDQIHSSLSLRFEEPAAYAIKEDVDDEFDFPEIPEIPNLADERLGMLYSQKEITKMIDDFLLKREMWRDKWEHMTEEHRVVLEKYINDRIMS